VPNIDINEQPTVQVKNSEEITKLLKALNDDDDTVRKAAIRTLGELGDSRAVDSLVQLLKPYETFIPDDDTVGRYRDANRYDDVHEAIAKALGAIGDARAVPQLIEVLGDDDNHHVFLAVAEALGTIGDSRAVSPLIEVIGVCSKYGQTIALKALGAIGDPQAVEPLIEMLNSNKYYDVRKAVAEVLGAIGDSRAVPSLIELFEGNLVDNDVREAAAEALGAIGDSRAVPPLSKALGSNNNKKRKAAVMALIDIGDTRTVPPLLESLRNDYYDFSRIALKKLVDSSGSHVVTALIELLKDNDHDSRRTVAEMLGDIGNNLAVSPLIELLKNDDDRYVRMAAAKALGDVGDPRAVDSLIEIIENSVGDAHPYRELNQRSEYKSRTAIFLCKNAAEALGKLGDPRAVDSLIKVLKTCGSQVHETASEAFIEIGDGSAIEPLLKTLESRDERVRKAAFKVLGALSQRDENIGTSVTGFVRVFKKGSPYGKQLLEKLPPPVVGAEFERLLLFEDAIDWYLKHGMPEESAAARRKQVNMGVAKVSQKVVHGDEVVTVQDSVVTRSTIGGGSNDLMKQLQQLADMREKGQLTDEEFKMFKEKLLKR